MSNKIWQRDFFSMKSLIILTFSAPHQTPLANPSLNQWGQDFSHFGDLVGHFLVVEWYELIFLEAIILHIWSTIYTKCQAHYPDSSSQTHELDNIIHELDNIIPNYR